MTTGVGNVRLNFWFEIKNEDKALSYNPGEKKVSHKNHYTLQNINIFFQVKFWAPPPLPPHNVVVDQYDWNVTTDSDQH